MNRRWLLPALLIGLFAVLSMASALSESLTFDEIVHSQEGMSAWLNHTFDVDPYNPPLIREILMAPIVAGAGRFIHSTLPAMQLFPARAMNVLLGAWLLGAVYVVVKRYAGRRQALLALFLLALEPTLLGHSHYVTLDAGAVLFFFLAYAAFLRLMEDPSTGRLLAAALALGAAIASKLLAIPFYVVSALIIGLGVYRKKFIKIASSPFHWIVFSLCTALVVWGTYFFTSDVLIAKREDSGRLSVQLGEYAREKNMLLLEQILRFGETQKLPLGGYLATIKNTILHGRLKAQIFSLGGFYAKAPWYGMIQNLFLKEPIALWILFILGCLVGRKRAADKRRFVLFVIPFLVMLMLLSVSGLTPWARYGLSAIPFLAITASESFQWFQTVPRRVLLVILCLWYAAAAGSSFPHYISYANEFAGRGENRYLLLMDANLDWGQSLPDMARFVQRVKPAKLRFSYFGRDNGDAYGLVSNFPYGSHRYEDICAFHIIERPQNSGPEVTAISVSNWYYCGYYRDPAYAKAKIQSVIGDSILLFYD